VCEEQNARSAPPTAALDAVAAAQRTQLRAMAALAEEGAATAAAAPAKGGAYTDM
jgi:hypothetical protein